MNTCVYELPLRFDHVTIRTSSVIEVSSTCINSAKVNSHVMGVVVPFDHGSGTLLPQVAARLLQIANVKLGRKERTKQRLEQWAIAILSCIRKGQYPPMGMLVETTQKNRIIWLVSACAYYPDALIEINHAHDVSMKQISIS